MTLYQSSITLRLKVSSDVEIPVNFNEDRALISYV
jgi:hypothetical protein